MAAAPWIVSDDLWELVQPLLPKKERRFRYPGRRRLPERETARDPVRAAHRDLVDAPASRAGLWFGNHLLASAR
jgi:transposase